MLEIYIWIINLTLKIYFLTFGKYLTKYYWTYKKGCSEQIYKIRISCMHKYLFLTKLEDKFEYIETILHQMDKDSQVNLLLCHRHFMLMIFLIVSIYFWLLYWSGCLEVTVLYCAVGLFQVAFLYFGDRLPITAIFRLSSV